jgi:hypothetical protein
MIASDTEQLHRIERSIAGLESRSSRDQMRLKCLIDGLRQEQRKLLSRWWPEDRAACSMEMALALGHSN